MIVYQDNLVTLRKGHVLDVLKEMEGESVHCVVTSPPYWRLRDYGLEPQVWDDPNDQNTKDCTHLERGSDGRCFKCGHCEHKWGEERKIKANPDRSTGDHDANGSGIFTDRTPRGSQPAKSARGAEKSQGQFCQHCNAWKGSLGLEPTPELFIQHIVQVFREVRRVLRKDGSCWVNIGDSYIANKTGSTGDHSIGLEGGRRTQEEASKRPTKKAAGLKPKDLCGIPWRVALALQADGWWLRSDITWCKGSPMPESVTDRPTNATEMIFLLAKSQKYYYDSFAVRQPSSTRTTNLTSFGSSTLAPKNSTTFKTDNVSPDFRGKLDFCESQITIKGTMALKTSDLKIFKSIRFTIIGEIPEWGFMVDLQSGVGTASLTSITSFLKGLSSHDTPVRATIINPSATPCGTSNANSVLAIPETGAFSATKNMLHAGPKELLTGIVEESATALIAFHFDEFNTAFFVFGAFRSSHIDHDNKNTNISQDRNLWNYWLINPKPFPGAHFATFSPKIPEIAIKAGTSQKGCCPECGQNWVRVVEKTFIPQPDVSLERGIKGAAGQKPMDKSSSWDGVPRGSTESKTIGWKPSCAHKDLKPVPCIVCDPFCGSGRALIVAKKLGRRGIGIDLKGEYLEMPRKELAQERLF